MCHTFPKQVSEPRAQTAFSHGGLCMVPNGPNQAWDMWQCRHQAENGYVTFGNVYEGSEKKSALTGKVVVLRAG